MKSPIIFCILLIFTTIQLFSQNTPSTSNVLIIKSLQQYESGKGQIQIIQNKKIDNIIAQYINNNPHQRTIPGYRIRIFSDSNQGNNKKALEVKAKFMNNFSDIEPYMEYISPWRYIYVGNFRTLGDAFRAKNQIEIYFPNAFIVEKEIDYTKL